ncbi:MAG TPA: hypothetical protein VFV75_01950 [Candidatus Polarisedimenticolaceae bacterium]|nr:hypothetical protein [Candidatus Polarisedimenticolaceae bacterium]
MGHRIFVSALLASLLWAGRLQAKGGEATYHDPNMDFGSIQTVAVMPFANLTGNAKAGETVRDVFMTMLQATGTLYVVPPGEVGRGISRLSLREATAPSAEDLKQLAQLVSAEVVITGVVSEYGELRSGGTAANVMTFSVRMQEAQTGKVIFSGSASDGGVSLGNRMFGGGGRPMNDVTRRAVKKLLDQLFD